MPAGAPTRLQRAVIAVTLVRNRFALPAMRREGTMFPNRVVSPLTMILLTEAKLLLREDQSQ